MIIWWTNNELKTAHHSRSTANSIAMIYFDVTSFKQTEQKNTQYKKIHNTTINSEHT